jgi:hypothetical protein
MKQPVDIDDSKHPRESVNCMRRAPINRVDAMPINIIAKSSQEREEEKNGEKIFLMSYSKDP